MALTPSALNSIASTTNASTYASSSFAAGAAGRAVFMWVKVAEASGTVPTPYITGHSDLPFELLGASVGSNPLTDGVDLLALYGCLATGTASDTYTVDFDGNTQANCLTSVFEISGFDTAPAVIGDAVSQLETATFTSATSASITLDTFPDADDIYVFAVGIAMPATEDITPEGSATEIHDIGIGSPNRSLFTSYKANDTSPSASWTNASAGQAGAAVINSTGVVSGVDDFIVHTQLYNETGSGTLMSFAPSVTPTTGNTLVVCVTVEHFETTTYTPGNSYTLMTDPDVSTMTYEIANSTFDRQLWYSKVADGDDNFELTAGTGTGGWNLAYWELDGEFEIASVVSTYNSGSTRTLDPSAIADPGSNDVVYTIGWSAVHFEGAADPVTFTGIGTGALIDRGDIATTGGTKAQTSAADRSWNNGNILNQNVVISNNAITGPRNTCVAWIPVGGGGIEVNPTGFSVPVTFGAPTLSHSIAVTGLSVPVTFGSPILQIPFDVTPSGFSVPVNFGSPALQIPFDVTPSGFSVPVTFGAPTLSFSVTPSGFSVPVTFGAPILEGSINPAGLAVPVTFGAPTLSFESNDVFPSGFSVPVTFGTPTLEGSVTPSGLAVPIAFGSPALSLSVTPAGFVQTVTFGAPALSFSITPSGLAVPVNFGAPTLTIPLVLTPTGLAVPVTFGQPVLSGLALLITAKEVGWFVRLPGTPKRLALTWGARRTIPIGFRTSETWERVSARFAFNSDNTLHPQTTVAAAWAAHQGAATATLTAAINQALHDAGYRTATGGDLV